MSYKNSEGYVDSTAGKAIKNVNAELNTKHSKLVHTLRDIADLAGFEIVGRITFKHKKTGRIF